MAKLKVNQYGTEENPRPLEEIEIRAWGTGGNANQVFLIGNGVNFNASSNIWLEIIYTVNGVQIFYTRNFVQLIYFLSPEFDNESRLEKFVRGEVDSYGFGDMLPETSILIKRENFSFPELELDGEDLSGSSCELEISSDVGVVLGWHPPASALSISL